MSSFSSNSIDTSAGGKEGCTNASPSSIPSPSRAQREAFTAAAEALERGAGEGADSAASGGIQNRDLPIWAETAGKIVDADSFEILPLVSNSTSEHEVRYRKDQDRVVKRTWPGIFGQIPCVTAGRLDRQNALPSEYLRRMALQLAVFGGDIELEGVCVSDKPSLIIGQPPGEPSLVISQKFYAKIGIATNESIHEFLIEEGFRSVPGYFSYFRPHDRVVIVDAKPDNFIPTDVGLIPIDLQMSIFDPDQVAAVGFNTDQEAPSIYIPRP